LRAKKQTWREDATNRDASKQRARMRKKLLPLLEKEFNPEAVEHLAELSELAREDEALLSALARCAILGESREVATKIEARKLLCPLSEKSFYAEDSANAGNAEKENWGIRALSARMVRMLVDAQKRSGSEITALHVEQVLRLADEGENGKVLQLPGGVDVRRDDDTLIFLPRESGSAKSKSSKEYTYQVELGGAETAIAVKEMGCVIRLRSIDWPTAGRDTSKSNRLALDEQRLSGPLVLRSLRPGDRMRPEGHQHARKLTRLLNEKRISRWEREGWPVLESAKNIVWARGFVAAEFAATQSTRKAILVSEEPA
jgi:tRNA(Ile)-lysidine synthase